MTPVGDEGSHLLDIPDVVLVCEAFHRFTGVRIAPVGQLAVAMNGVIAAALQLIANGRLSGARKAFDQVIPPADVPEDSHRMPVIGRISCRDRERLQVRRMHERPGARRARP